MSCLCFIVQTFFWHISPKKDFCVILVKSVHLVGKVIRKKWECIFSGTYGREKDDSDRR